MLKNNSSQKNNLHLIAGAEGEEKAKGFLIKQGLQCIAQNYHCPFGEIDLIMADKETLIFIEVRRRKNCLYGSALESITVRKQKKVANSAQHFIQQNKKYREWPMRFDAVGITGEDMQWVKNAF